MNTSSDRGRLAACSRSGRLTSTRSRTWVAAAFLVLGVAGCGHLGGDVGSAEQAAGTYAHRATWTPIADGPLDARYGPLSVWDGKRFFVLGGFHDDVCGPDGDCAAADPPLMDAAAYTPSTDRWTRIADAPVGLTGRAVVLGGVIYVHTWPTESTPATFVSYDIATDSWSRHPSPMRDGWLVATDDSVVMFSTGKGTSYRYDADADTWRPLPPNPFWQDGGYPVWTGHEVVVAGNEPSHLGQDPPLVKLASLDSSLRHWTDLGGSDIVGAAPVAVDGRVVWPSPLTANGGGEGTGDWGKVYDEGGIYDPATETWTTMPASPERDGGTCCGVATDNLVDVYGALLDPVTREWTEAAVPDGGVRMHAAMVGGDDTVLLWGGVANDDPSRDLLDSGFLLHTGPDGAS